VDKSKAAGVERVSDRVAAYLQPPWSFGLSNAGIVTGRHGSIIIDTLFDLAHTRRMLEGFGESFNLSTDKINYLVNTHHNGDHCWGNQLLSGSQIVSHRLCREFMPTLPPQALGGLVSSLGDSPAASYLKHALTPFDFSDIELTLPTTVFEEQLTIPAGDDPLELIYVGPAHTAGDLVAYFPCDGVVFTGDVVFRLCTPIGWEGTFDNWVAALDRILALDFSVLVPGHGPLCGREGAEEMRSYLLFVREEAKRLFDAEVPLREAAARIDPGPYACWAEPERIVFSLARAYREFRGEPWDQPVDFIALAELMAEIAK